MTRRIMLALPLVAIVFAVAIPVQAAGTKKHSINGTVKLAVLSQTGMPPTSGSTENAGSIRGALGRGALTGTTTYGPVPEFKASFRAYYNGGSMKITASGRGEQTPGSDTVSFSGSGKVVGGTGRFKGAKGSFTFSGSAPANQSNLGVATYTIKGSARY